MHSRSRTFAHWRALGPRAALDTALAAIEAWDDPALFISRTPLADLRVQAAALDMSDATDLPLRGLPFVVKDNIDVAGLPTTAACPAFAYRPGRSAFVVDRLVAAGAICLGKVNLDQFATGLNGTRSPYGVPRNALHPDLVPGGSSSGSATAVGAGLCAFSLGTDTAGSGRVPAALNGIVGLKPSLGMLSATGMVPACRTLDTISVFAACTADAVEATAVAQGYDPADFQSRALPPIHLPPRPGPLRIGVPRPDQRRFFDDTQAETAFDADLKTLESHGATLIEVDFAPFYAVAALLYDGPWVAERYHAVRGLIERDPDALHPVTRGIIEGARAYSAVDAFDGIYRLSALRRQVAPVLADLDLLAVPSIPRPYSVAQMQADPVRLNGNLGTYTNFVNFLDLCAVSVPVGRRGDGLPSSLTLIAPAGQDSRAAAMAAALDGTG